MDAHRKNLPCNLCGSGDTTVLFEAGVAQASRIVKCVHCGLMYASPRAKLPDQDEIAGYDPEFTKKTLENSRDRYEKEQLADKVQTWLEAERLKEAPTWLLLEPIAAPAGGR